MPEATRIRLLPAGHVRSERLEARVEESPGLVGGGVEGSSRRLATELLLAATPDR